MSTWRLQEVRCFRNVNNQQKIIYNIISSCKLCCAGLDFTILSQASLLRQKVRLCLIANFSNERSKRTEVVAPAMFYQLVGTRTSSCLLNFFILCFGSCVLFNAPAQILLYLHFITVSPRHFETYLNHVTTRLCP
jgi:hypothetical protein